ncbi:hypothetical protein PMAYCL1PPCAC_27661, partial [Pristionchus mayeri]
ILLVASSCIAIFPVVILRTRAISAHFRFLLLLLWFAHLLIVADHWTYAVMRWGHNDFTGCCVPWLDVQVFRMIHDIGFYLSTPAMFLLIFDRFLITLFYKTVNERQMYFRRAIFITVPIGVSPISKYIKKSMFDFAITEACIIAHTCDAISYAFCAITYFRSKIKYRESFTHVTLDTRFSLFESQELNLALLPVCIMDVFLKNLSLTTVWIYAIHQNMDFSVIMLPFYSISTINVFLAQASIVYSHRILWKRFKEIFGCKTEERKVPSEKEQLATYFEMMDKQYLDTIFDYFYIFEILIVILSLCSIVIFPVIILRTRAISVHFRFLLLLLWFAHFLLIVSHVISITLRWVHQDNQYNQYLQTISEFQFFRLIHDVGFFLTSPIMFLLICDRFLFTLFYKRVERRQMYFKRVTIITVPLGV